MTTASDLPETIALFPLPGALLLPRAKLPLHIFEPRYRAMIEDSLMTRSRLIGMIQPRTVPAGSEGRLHAIGCAGRLTSFSETEDGRYMITLTGTSRFRLIEEVFAAPTATPGQAVVPYRRARVSWTGFERDLGASESDPGLDRPAFVDLLERYFSSVSLSIDWSSLKDAPDELLIDALSMLCPFQPDERQALLEAPSLSTRRETLTALMAFALAAPGGSGGKKGEILQ